MRSALGFQNYDANLLLLAEIVFKIYLSVLAIVAIQFLLSIRFKTIMIPLGAGLVAVIAGLMLQRCEKIIYYPYIFPMLTDAQFLLHVFGKGKEPFVLLSRYEISSLLYSSVLFINGYFWISKRDVD